MNEAERRKVLKKFPSKRLSLLLAINNGAYVLLELEKKKSRLYVCLGYARQTIQKTRYCARTCTSIRSGAAPSHELIIRHLYAIPSSFLLLHSEGWRFLPPYVIIEWENAEHNIYIIFIDFHYWWKFTKYFDIIMYKNKYTHKTMKIADERFVI